ncbi:MAG: translation elongation factor 4 [bacterium]|nr:translation elongation factor 4 [bacterium]
METETQKIRNFSIIAHIDHGKSTLADRLLELTKTVEVRQMHSQYLDMMDLEQERGITIKMQPVRMQYNGYILNLIDTPGHVDFSYEVSRSLAAVEGVILLVDGTKGIQAQTLAHLSQAQKQNKVIIAAVNKIDLPNARPEEIEEELKNLLGQDVEIFKISAKDGTNVDKLLDTVIERIPSPKNSPSSLDRALIFDSTYDSYKGVLAYVRVFNGSFRGDQKIKLIAQNKEAGIMEVGHFKPQLSVQKEIKEGEIGFIATGLKDPSLIRVGDTAVIFNSESQFLDLKNFALEGYKDPSPVVFASLFPKDGAEFAMLKDSLLKLKLSDAALTFELDSQEVLGRGFRCGFLGSLHMEIVLERLEREYNLSLITTTPSVSYEIVLRDGTIQNIFSAADLPTSDRYLEIREPWVTLTLLSPSKYIGGILELLAHRRGISKHTEYISEDRVEIFYEIPLAEIIVDFHDKLKSVSSGYASLSYEFLELRKGDLIKLDILVASETVDALSRIVPSDQAQEEGKRIVERLKELLPRQWFEVMLQAAIGGKIIARENIAALKKDVTSHMYGGDITRKMKLREKQKKGKKKMKERGRVDIPNSVFFELLKR